MPAVKPPVYYALPRRLIAEALGTCLLVATVVGSGIMAQRLSTDTGVMLLANALATGAILYVLINMLGPISGAHFNPVVTFSAMFTRDIEAHYGMAYVAAQVAGGLAGTALAHLMFELAPLTGGTIARTGDAQLLSEAVASFGLVATIIAGRRFRPEAIPAMVALYIIAAYWFTASTSFANPAVTIARAFTDTFSGIRPADMPFFIVAQLGGALVASLVMPWLMKLSETPK
ncbi:aquaporin [Devosia sp.]|uniref:aquaporin n=1 Tax=Devosia sp. TaxID=1871048 RepID=UPI003A8E8487